MTWSFKPSSNGRPLPQTDHLEGCVLATRLTASELRIASIGAANRDAVETTGREFDAKG